MIVAVTFAMDWEFAPWRRLRSFRRCADGHGPAYETQVGAVSLRIVPTGVGRRAADAAAERLFQPRPDFLITSGTAGALGAELRVADVVVARSVRRTGSDGVDSDPRLRALAVECGATAVGTLFTSPTIVARAEQKRVLGSEADVVDMESAFIMNECARRGIPGIAIRAISDAAGTDMPIDFNSALTETGDVSLVRLLSAIGKRPHALPALVRLGLDSRRAVGALVTFLDAYVERLGVLRDR